MTSCAYCNANPPIENSHVVPAFIVRFLKKNNPSEFILNSWAYRKAQDGLKGPYLCAQCDNVLFSGWENQFKKRVFDPLRDGQKADWQDESCIRFLLSVAFRYTVHFLETSPHEANAANNLLFRDLTRKAMDDLAILDSQLFIYPYQCRPIVEDCSFMVGINHALHLAFHCWSLPAEDKLPNALLMLLPGILVLLTDRDLAAVNDPDLLNPTSLAVGRADDFGSVNLTMPQFVRPILNGAVGQTSGHQKSMELWGEIDYGADKLANPDKPLYKMQALDSRLQAWQNSNCPRR